MVGVLIATHGELADGLRSASNLIVGEQEQLDTIGLFEGNDFDVFKDSIKEKMLALDTGDGVLVFVDLLAATPYNASAFTTQELKEQMKVRVVAGTNLPMVLETLMTRTFETDLDVLYKGAISEGKEGIVEFLEQVE
jgi:Phosphotransferase system, mannose/fructose-specific component IIA